MEKRRVIGVSLNVAEHNTALQLGDGRISRIYYITLGTQEPMARRALDYVTSSDFSNLTTEQCEEIDNLYVNVFFAEAFVKDPLGLKKTVLLPKVSADVPFFLKDDSMIMLKRLRKGANTCYVYVNESLGVIEFDPDLITGLSYTRYSHLLEQDADEIIKQNIAGIKQQLQTMGISGAKCLQLISDNSALSYFDRLTNDQQKAVAIEVYQQLLQFNDAERRYERDEFDKLCLLDAGMKYDSITDDMLRYTASIILPIINRSAYDIKKTCKSTHDLIPALLATLNTRNAFYKVRLNKIANYLREYFNTLAEKSAEVKVLGQTKTGERATGDSTGFSGVRLINVQERTENGSLGASGASQRANLSEGVQKSGTGREGDEEAYTIQTKDESSIHNSASSHKPYTQLAEPGAETVQPIESTVKPVKQFTEQPQSEPGFISEETKTADTVDDTPKIERSEADTLIETASQIMITPETSETKTLTAEEAFKETEQKAKEESERSQARYLEQAKALLELQKRSLLSDTASTAEHEVLDEFPESPYEDEELLEQDFHKSLESAVANLTKQLNSNIKLDGDADKSLLDQGNCLDGGCPICHGTGYVMSPNGFKVPCPNKPLVSKMQKANHNAVTMQLQDQLVRLATTQGLIPKAYFDTVWDPDINLDRLRSILKTNGLELSPSDLSNFKKVLSTILHRLLLGNLPDISYLISAPNGAGKATFTYTLLKVLVSKRIKVVPYISLVELSEVYKDYLRYIGNLSRIELKANTRVSEEYFTSGISTDEIEELSTENSKPGEYSNYLRKARYRYKDFLEAPLLVCTMSQDKVSLPVEFATLKSLLESRSRRNLPTIVFTELLSNSLGYEFTVGDEQNGLYTMATKDRSLASYDRMYWLELKPVKHKFLAN